MPIQRVTLTFTTEAADRVIARVRLVNALLDLGYCVEPDGRPPPVPWMQQAHARESLLAVQAPRQCEARVRLAARTLS